MGGRSATTTRVLGMIRRVRAARVDDSGDVQLLQVGEHSEDVPDVPHVLPYGLAVGLPRKAEGIVALIGAAWDHVVALGFNYSRHRPRNLAEGDVTLYCGHGVQVDLRDGAINLVVPSGAVVRLGTASATERVPAWEGVKPIVQVNTEVILKILALLAALKGALNTIAAGSGDLLFQTADFDPDALLVQAGQAKASIEADEPASSVVKLVR